MPGVAAPITKPPFTSRMPIIPGMRLVSTINSGLVRPLFICTSRSVPPDNGLARPEVAASILTASLTVVGEANVSPGIVTPDFERLAGRVAHRDALVEGWG